MSVQSSLLMRPTCWWKDLEVDGSDLLKKPTQRKTTKPPAEMPTLHTQCGEKSLEGMLFSDFCTLAYAAFDLTVLLTCVVLYTSFVAKEHSTLTFWAVTLLSLSVAGSYLRRLCVVCRDCAPCLARACHRPASTSAERSPALRAACTVHQPADCVDAWTEIFSFVGSVGDEMQFGKVSRAHAGIARTAHERQGLRGFVWWSSAPTVQTFITSLLKGSLAIRRQRMVAPVYAYEVKGASRLQLTFQGLPLPPVLDHAKHHVGFYLKDLQGLPSFEAEVHVWGTEGGMRNWWYLTTPHARHLAIGNVDASLRWISIDMEKVGAVDRLRQQASGSCS